MWIGCGLHVHMSVENVQAIQSLLDTKGLGSSQFVAAYVEQLNRSISPLEAGEIFEIFACFTGTHGDMATWS
jgi:hypothetical protein